MVHVGEGDDVMVSDPDDAVVEAVLRAAPKKDWKRFRRAVDRWRARSAPAATWPPMEPINPGGDPPIYEFPHPTYSKEVDDVLAALGGIGAVFAFDWGAADLPSRYPRGDGLDVAPVADAARMATTFIRAERFVDGAIEEAIDKGIFDATLDRLVAFADSEGL